MTKWADNSQRLAWAKDSILSLFIKDASPKTVKEICNAPYLPSGENTIRRALNELCQEKRLFESKRRSNTFVYRLPDTKQDKWWLNAVIG